MLKHVSLFTGLAGIDLAAHLAGFETIAMVEIAPFPRAILRQWFPHVPLWKDVRHVEADAIRRLLNGERLHLLSGGYPCQPFALPGRRHGAGDPRHMWPHMLRLVRELGPAWVLGENVEGHITLGLDEVLDDLANEGYEGRAFVYPASAVGAPHQRNRVFIVAHANGSGLEERTGRRAPLCTQLPTAERSSDTVGGRILLEPDVGRTAHAISAELDGLRWPLGRGDRQHPWEASRTAARGEYNDERITGLGNAVVWAQVYPILAGIAAWENWIAAGGPAAPVP